MSPEREQSDLGPYFCNIGYLNTYTDEREDDKCRDWRANG